MQTYTHLMMGAALGLGMFPNQPIAQLAIVAGSVAPDLSMIPAFAWDKLNGRQPLAVQTKLTMFLKNIGHNFWLWFLGTIIVARLAPLPIALVVFAFGIGGIIHLLVDLVSHNDPRFEETEANLFWPMTKRPVGVGHWDYRYGHGKFRPKWPEVIVLALSAASAIYFFLS